MDHPLGPTPSQVQALQLAYDRLQQQQQFQAAFLGSASHELRAPINQIISLHQLILEDLCENPAEEREFLTQANGAIQTVLKNLDLLISLSKLEVGGVTPNLQELSLAPVLDRVQQLTQMKSLNRHCRLMVAQVDSMIVVWSDRQWLLQLLVMLVDTAIDLGSDVITLDVAPVSQEVVLTLHCDRPLEPLSELVSVAEAEASPRTGYDLSPEFRGQLAARIVPHLGGQLDCRQLDGKGTEWNLQLPRETPTAGDIP